QTAPATSFSSCVFPAPLAPANTQRSPGRMVQLMSFRTLRPARCRLTCSRRTSRYRVAERLIRGIGSQLPCSDGLFFARADLQGVQCDCGCSRPATGSRGPGWGCFVWWRCCHSGGSCPLGGCCGSSCAACRAQGGQGIPKGGIRAFLPGLKDNEGGGYAPHQSYRKKGAQMAPPVSIPGATHTPPPRLARMTGATVLPYFLQRLPGAQGYRATIHPPLENFPSDCPVTDTARFNHMIEAQVRVAPEQYLWIHRRFKGLSEDYPDYYGQR